MAEQQKDKAKTEKDSSVDSDDVLAKVREALMELEGFGEGRSNGIIGAIWSKGVHFVF